MKPSRHIRIALPALLGSVVWADAHAQEAAADARLVVETCIREQAPRVEQAFESLIDATTFLVGSVCAQPIRDLADIARREAESRRQERLEAMCAEATDPDPFDSVATQLAAQCQSRQFMELYTDAYYDGYSEVMVVGGATADAETVSLAAELLLDARLARRSAGE